MNIPKLPPALLKVLKVAAAVGLLVITPLLAFSQATIKSLIDQWLGQCVIVISVVNNPPSEASVDVSAFGTMPTSLPLTFTSQKGLLRRISFVNQVERGLSGDNLAVHPQASQFCPGALCRDTPEASERLSIRINGFSANYDYRFQVLFAQDDLSNGVTAYVLPQVSDKLECRVERASWTNYFARASRGMKLILLFLAATALILIVGWLRVGSGETS